MYLGDCLLENLNILNTIGKNDKTRTVRMWLYHLFEVHMVKTVKVQT